MYVIAAYCVLLKNSNLSFFADVIFSGIGAAIWTVIIVTWVVMFQVNRAKWGEFADNISFIIPQGMP